MVAPNAPAFNVDPALFTRTCSTHVIRFGWLIMVNINGSRQLYVYITSSSRPTDGDVTVRRQNLRGNFGD